MANDQLKVVYAQLDNLLDTDDVSETIADFRADKKATAIKVLHVVAAAIFNKQGDLLIIQRPQDKHMRGGEFPGGKVKAGEAVTDALCRELDEELNIQPLSWEMLICIEHAYPVKQLCSMPESSRIFMAKPVVGKGKP